MPKIKTNKSAKKRFRFTKKGKVKRFRSFRRHNLTKKSRKRKRLLRKASFVSHAEAHIVKKLMPYG